MEQVNAVNDVTNNLIGSTSRLLKEQGVEIQKDACNTGIHVETMKKAFQDTFEALDALDVYRQKAIPQMKTLIEQFNEMAVEGNKRIQRIEEASSYKLLGEGDLR